MSTENKNCTNKVVAEHLSKGIIEKCSPCRGQFLSNIFLRPKPNGKHRLILDLSDLNDSVVYRHFNMESLQTAIDLVQKDCYLGSLDLSDAYYSIPVAKEDRTLLRFKWGGGGTFTKVLKPVFATLQERGHSCFGYIDDTFIMGETQQQCENTIRELQKLLVGLGFKIHEQKSIVKSTTELGYVINTRKMTVTPTKDKIRKFKETASDILAKDRNVVREVARLIGLMVDYPKGLDYGEVGYIDGCWFGWFSRYSHRNIGFVYL